MSEEGCTKAGGGFPHSLPLLSCTQCQVTPLLHHLPLWEPGYRSKVLEGLQSQKWFGTYLKVFGFWIAPDPVLIIDVHGAALT